MKRKISIAAIIVITITIISLLLVSCNGNTPNDSSDSSISEQSSSIVINSSVVSEDSSEYNSSISEESNELESENESSSGAEASSKSTENKKTTSTSKTNISAKTTVTPKPTATPATTHKPVATSTPTPTKTPTPSNICPVCDCKLNTDGSCNTIHNYTGYGWQEYDESTGIVYIKCNTCGQRWNRNSYIEPRDWVYDHALACYNKANESYMECGYCGKEWPESKWGEMYKGMYCNRECAMATGYYCPTCESSLYMDGCHNCGYKEICSSCGKEQDGGCLKQYCTVCASHAGHGADAHCPSCGSTEHTTHPALDNNEYMGDSFNPGDNGAGDNPSVEDPFAYSDGCVGEHTNTGNCENAPKCGAVGHSADGTCSVCGSTYTTPKCGTVGHSVDGTCSVCGSIYTTPKCGAIGHTESGNCPVCGATKALDNNEYMGDSFNPGYSGTGTIIGK